MTKHERYKALVVKHKAFPFADLRNRILDLQKQDWQKIKTFYN